MEMKNIPKNIFAFVCLCGLVYQTVILYSEYMSGNTVVNIKVDRILNETIPAITVCFDAFASLEMVSQLSPHLANLSIDYMNERDRFLNNRSIGRAKAVHYRNVLEIELNKLFDNMTVWKFYDEITIQFNKHFEVQLHGHSMIKENYPDLFHGFDSIILKGAPIESFGEIHDRYKCFTFFSALQKQWRDFKINIKSIFFQILRPYPDNFYPYDNGTFHFAIHSPNTLPVLSNGKDFMHLENNLKYNLHYSRVETQLLDSGFDTNCFDYDLDHKFANYKMRSD